MNEFMEDTKKWFAYLRDEMIEKNFVVDAT